MAPKKRRTRTKARAKPGLSITTYDNGATRRRTLTVLKRFLDSPTTIDIVAAAVGMSRRSVSRIISDARRVGFDTCECECGCKAFVIRSPMMMIYNPVSTSKRGRSWTKRA